MKTYVITARTNFYTANRDSLFNENKEVLIGCRMSLEAAQLKLIELFNQKNNTGFLDWGQIKRYDPNSTMSYKDGTRLFEYDGRTYEIFEASTKDFCQLCQSEPICYHRT